MLQLPFPFRLLYQSLDTVNLRIKFNGLITELLLVSNQLRQFQNLVVLLIKFYFVLGEVHSDSRFDFEHLPFE